MGLRPMYSITVYTLLYSTSDLLLLLLLLLVDFFLAEGAEGIE